MQLPTWWTYSILTLLASLPFYLFIQRRGGVQSDHFNSRLRRLMWIPAIVAFGFRWVRGEGFADVAFDAGRWPLLLLAVLLPFVVEVLLIALASALGWAKLSPKLISLKGGKVTLGGELDLILGSRPQSPGMFGANLVLTVVIGGVYTALFTLGAEFGWRGYLLPRAIDSLGLNAGFVATGLVWALWQLPLVLMGYQYPRYPALGALLMTPVGAVFLSVVTGILYFAAGSIWAPTLLHAGLQVTGSLSRTGLGEGGDDLRVRLLWVGLWALIALSSYVWWV